MLIFVGSRRQTHILRHMQRDARRPDWICRTYQWLYRTGSLPAGTYIFTGVDRLDAGERRLAAQFYRHINAQGPGFRAMNDPAVAMGRYRLLRTLHEAGINDFNAYLATEPHEAVRFPAFIRSATASQPPHTGMIESAEQLQSEIERLVARGEPREDLLIIEFHAEEVAPGLHRKQAEYRFGDRYVPNPSIYAGSWYVKYSNSVDVDEQYVDYDRAVLADNPLAETARQAFEIAGIEYGRADIGIVGGRPQIYEINFNPDLRTQIERPNRSLSLRALWTECDNQTFAALKAIDQPATRAARTLTTSELTAFRLRFWRNYAPQRY